MADEFPVMEKATIGDVARAAGVGVGTVSRVLNKEKVRPALAGRVMQAVRETGYVYRPRPWPWLAKRKFRRTCGDVGVLFFGAGNDFMARPDVPCLLHCIERALAAQGRSLVVGNVSHPASFSQFLKRRRLDGVIFIHLGGGGKALSVMEQAGSQARHVPHVWVNERPANTAGVLCRIDTGRAGMLAADLLARRGHRHVAFVDDGSGGDFALMAAAFAERARKNAMEVSLFPAGTPGVVEHVAEGRATALFAPHYGTALRLSDGIAQVVEGRRLGILTCVLEKVLMQEARTRMTVLDLRLDALIELAIDHLIWRMAKSMDPSECLNLSIEPVPIEKNRALVIR